MIFKTKKLERSLVFLNETRDGIISYSKITANQLPFDSDYIGMVHSHPVGPAEPSSEDLHNFFGLVSVIVKSPYEDEDIFAWDSSGNSIPILDE